MKILYVAAAAAIAFSAPAFSQTSVEELFAMSNDSAAETIVREHSMGDITAAQIKLALGNMSAAERKVFFDSPQASRDVILSCMKKTDSGDSAAESCSIQDN